jgi:chemotaxis protein CheZ
MKEHLKVKIANIINGKLTKEQTKELESFFMHAFSSNLEYDENFFRSLSYEMTGELKKLALLIIDYRKDLKSKIEPGITDLTTKHIPQATDQLEGVIEATEIAANKIMDNLENMQVQTERIKGLVTSLKNGEIGLPEGNNVSIDSQAIVAISPFINHMEAGVRNYMSLISDSFDQMSFQDLTGQRIKRIITLVGEMEEKLTKMIIAFGIKLTEREKNPDISKEELQKAVEEKVTELAGPQREGQGLDQGDIDALLSNL